MIVVTVVQPDGTPYSASVIAKGKASSFQATIDEIKAKAHRLGYSVLICSTDPIEEIPGYLAQEESEWDEIDAFDLIKAPA